MLTDEQIYENKMRFLQLLTKLGIDLTKLIDYLDSPRADFFMKPYSAYPDGAYAGALCEHNLKLYDELVNICNIFAPNQYSEQDLIIAALFSELYKAELYESYSKNVKNEATGKWEAVLAYRNKEVRPSFGDIGLSSFMILNHFLDLTDDQAVAIIYSTTDTFMDSYMVKKCYPLITLVQMAQKAVALKE